MEAWGILGLIAFIWCITLSAKVARLERQLKETGAYGASTESLKELIHKNLGKWCKITLEESLQDTELLGKKALLKDVDEQWLLVKIEKKETEKLIRLNSIKSIQL